MVAALMKLVSGSSSPRSVRQLHVTTIFQRKSDKRFNSFEKKHHKSRRRNTSSSRAHWKKNQKNA
jgi:hypothetical protein